MTKLPANAVIRIFDINGKQVIMNVAAQKDTQVDVKKLIHGMYFIKLEDAEGEVYYSSKFLKQ